MERIPVKSSQIVSVGYDPSTQTLEIEFRPMRADTTETSVYQYSNVPSKVWDEMHGAASVGSFFHKRIKGVYAYNRIS
jgi:hypothetical protein